MKDFLRVQFDPVKCRQELDAFGQLLVAKRALEENADIKPFFEANQFTGLLVVGRDDALDHPREQRRWEWRAQKVFVNGLPVLCVTYDQLHRFLANKLNLSPTQQTQAG